MKRTKAMIVIGTVQTKKTYSLFDTSQLTEVPSEDGDRMKKFMPKNP